MPRNVCIASINIYNFIRNMGNLVKETASSHEVGSTAAPAEVSTTLKYTTLFSCVDFVSVVT